MRRRVPLPLVLTCVALPAALWATASIWIALFIYRPAPLGDGRPGDWGLPGAREVTVVSAGRERLSGWWAPPPRPTSPVVLLLHGRSANISTRAPVAARLHADGFGVLLADYRGYGRSTGRPSEAGLSEDAAAMYDWLRAQGVGGRRIVVVGQSLGDAPAARLARLRDVRALVLVSPFTSLPGALSARLGLPAFATPPWPRNRFDVEASVRGSCLPLVLVASRQDGLVPYADSRRLAAAACDPRWLEVDGQKHDGLLGAAARSGRLSRALIEATAGP